jgi:hypothetical protein
MAFRVYYQSTISLIDLKGGIMGKKNIGIILVLGVFFAGCILTGCSSKVDERINKLEETVKALDLKATRAQDVLDIMDLQARYEAIHSTQESLAWMLYADRPDSSDEVTHSRILGYEYIKMQFTDRQKLLELYHAGKLPAGTHIHEMIFPSGSNPGNIALAGGGPPAGKSSSAAKKVYGKGMSSIPAIHPVSSPNIIVAADGKTAKATFTSLGFERGGWCYGKYANDYIKIDGKWYIWHKKWLRGFSANYYKSPEDETIDEIFEWTKERDANSFPVVAKELSTNYLWYPGKENMTITAPQPYETWTDADNNGGWWKKATEKP